MSVNLTDIERTALDWLLAGEHPTLVTLRTQLRNASIESREKTGVGFFANFSLPPETERLSRRSRIVIGDVYAEVSGLEQEAGFLLFIDDGTLNFLECFIHDDRWPDDPSIIRAYYVRHAAEGSPMLIETADRDLELALGSAEKT